jgi:hypothetical protein
VNDCDVPVIKSKEDGLKKIPPMLKTPEHVASHRMQAKRVAKKTLSCSNQVMADIHIKK